MDVHESMRLHLSPEKYYIEPVDTGSNDLIVIDRVSQEITLQVNLGQIPPNAPNKLIYGIFGVIRLVAGPYLVVVTKKSKVGEINGQSIWKVTGTEVLSYKRTTLHLNEKQVQDNKVYLSMVDNVLGTEAYYFSTSYDLTHSLQRLHNTSPEFLQIPLNERADQRFVWNGHLVREFAQQPELSRYCLPILHGFVAVKTCTISGKTFNYVLISRRSCFRAGTRYYIRGLDSEGHAANYVETEQIVEYDGHRCSFVQTRGSIPLYWSQRPNLKYKPTPVLSGSLNHNDGFTRHFNAQLFSYGKQVLINLIDHKGPEDTLEKAFQKAVNSSGNSLLQYESFDFHHECRKMRWDRLTILTDKLDQDQRKFGYFMVRRDGSLVCQQEGVFRTNCIDCLDRTNVVQSMLARKSMQAQLEKLDILAAGDRVEDQNAFEFIFKNVWADNADSCAVQYAGTGALKTDFTRTGMRTKLGLLKDGVNAGLRYFKNNFSDGFRQDGIDLFLGNYQVDENEGITIPSPLRLEKDWRFFVLPAVLVVCMAMCIISVLMPDEHIGEQLMYVLFWGGASVLATFAIYVYGIVFVDQPRLTQAKFKTE